MRLAGAGKLAETLFPFPKPKDLKKRDCAGAGEQGVGRDFLAAIRFPTAPAVAVPGLP